MISDRRGILEKYVKNKNYVHSLINVKFVSKTLLRRFLYVNNYNLPQVQPPV